MTPAWRALALLAAASCVAACADETVVLATIPDVDASVPPPARCVQSSDCASGSFCERLLCDQPAGTCEPFPVQCPDDERPVCGCDGVTYFNDCLRQAAGVEGARPGECGPSGVRCGGVSNASCPAGALCARFLGFGPPPQQGCPPNPGGTCWVLPATCSDGGMSDRWDDCASGAQCVGTCAAVRSGDAYVRSRQCP